MISGAIINYNSYSVIIHKCHGLIALYGLRLGYRASTLVVLNSYIAIFSTTKYQNVPYNGGAKSIFFGSTATWLHCS